MNETPPVDLLCYEKNFNPVLYITETPFFNTWFTNNNQVILKPENILKYNQIVFNFSYQTQFTGATAIEGSNANGGAVIQRGGYNLGISINFRFSGTNVFALNVPWIYPELGINVISSIQNTRTFNWQINQQVNLQVQTDNNSSRTSWIFIITKPLFNYDILLNPVVGNSFYIDGGVSINPLNTNNTPRTTFNLKDQEISIIGMK